jgi:hypothetical protein
MLVRGLLATGTVQTFVGNRSIDADYLGVIRRVLNFTEKVDEHEPSKDKSPGGTVSLNFKSTVGYDALDPSTDLRVYSLITLAIDLLNMNPRSQLVLLASDIKVFLSDKRLFDAMWEGVNAPNVTNEAKQTIEALFTKAGLKGMWTIEFDDRILLRPVCMENTPTPVNVPFPLEATGCAWNSAGKFDIAEEASETES